MVHLVEQMFSEFSRQTQTKKIDSLIFLDVFVLRYRSTVTVKFHSAKKCIKEFSSKLMLKENFCFKQNESVESYIFFDQLILKSVIIIVIFVGNVNSNYSKFVSELIEKDHEFVLALV
ncbi:hypothetical protein BpHYR1_011940 [Brachionus plicatilis]|uniref:Uncharacterized protein n=1 Tax=Brachionus plicatilis TaxID=10195 RepID=A0A3M7T005_BRAPC|nr:hypothetical protein BpHYR1_011940 [Brachionus plicatilis]